MKTTNKVCNSKILIVRTQAELDAINPNDDVRIEIRDAPKDITVVRKYANVVLAYNSVLYAKKCCKIQAYGSSVIALDDSEISAYGNSKVFVNGNSIASVYDNSVVAAYGNGKVLACNNSQVEASENCTVEAFEDSWVCVHGNSSVIARDNTNVRAYENSRVIAYHYSRVDAYGNAQVLQYSDSASVTTNCNARIVHMPQNPKEYAGFYGVKTMDDNMILYKAVRRYDGKYHSDYDPHFIYPVGEEITCDCDPNPESVHSYGMHVSHLNLALIRGKCRPNLAILECAVPMDSIVIPHNLTGELRTGRLTVLREIPLYECGIFGKILGKRCFK